MLGKVSGLYSGMPLEHPSSCLYTLEPTEIPMFWNCQRCCLLSRRDCNSLDSEPTDECNGMHGFHGDDVGVWSDHNRK